MMAGEAADTLGVGIQTLHYYEREGLLPPVPRSESGYRLYTPEVMNRVAFIRKAQALGLQLAEIRSVILLARRGTAPCGRVQEALAGKLRDIDDRLRALRTFRNDLARILRQAPALSADSDHARTCGIVEAVALRPGVVDPARVLTRTRSQPTR